MTQLLKVGDYVRLDGVVYPVEHLYCDDKGVPFMIGTTIPRRGVYTELPVDMVELLVAEPVPPRRGFLQWVRRCLSMR